MIIKEIGIEQLKESGYNPRKKLKKEDIQYQKIKKSIQEFGYVSPIIVNKNLTIIGGHQRINVLKDLGYEKINVVILDLEKEKEKALNIALNKITGEWDIPLLKDLLQEVDTGDFNIEVTGFELSEIENLMTQYHIDSDVYAPTLQPQFMESKINDEIIEKKAQELASKIIKEQKLLTIRCPYCEEEFDVENK